MKTRSVLSGKDHTLAEYEAAKKEPVVLAPQGSPPWKAPHFVWQVRAQLGAILCGAENADTCEKVDTGGYRVITTLDWEMQQTVEKWLYAAARAPQAENMRAGSSTGCEHPRDRLELDQRASASANIHNARGGDHRLPDRPGPRLRRQRRLLRGRGTDTFQPQFDVLPTAWPPARLGDQADQLRHRHRRQDDDRGDDVHGRRDRLRRRAAVHADPGRRARARARSGSARRSSSRSTSRRSRPASSTASTTSSSGRRTSGSTFPRGAVPVDLDVRSARSRSTRSTCSSAYGAIANGGVLMPRQTILEVTRRGRHRDLPDRGRRAGRASAVVERRRPPTSSPTSSQGNTDRSRSTRTGATGRSSRTAQRRPAAYKTGHDVRQQGRRSPSATSPRRTTRPRRPSPSASGWATPTATPNNGSLSLDSSAPLWSRILTEVSQGLPIADFKQPAGLVTADGRRVQRPPARARTRRRRSRSCSSRAPCPTRTDDLHVELEIDPATGLLWQDGCAGPMVRQGFLDFSAVEPRFPSLAGRTPRTGRPAPPRARASAGGPEKHPDDATSTAAASRRSARPGAATFAPTEVCAPIVPPTCAPGTSSDPFATPDPSGAAARRRRASAPTPEPTPEATPPPDGGGGRVAAASRPPSPMPTRSPTLLPSRACALGRRRRHRSTLGAARPAADPRPRRCSAEADDRRSVATLAALAGPDGLHERMGRGRRPDGVAQRSGAEAVDDRHPLEARRASRPRGSGRAPSRASSTRAPRRSSDEATVRARESRIASTFEVEPRRRPSRARRLPRPGRRRPRSVPAPA